MAKPTNLVTIYKAAKSILKALQQLGFKCALHGDLACYIYGASHVPKEIEVMIFSPSGVFPHLDTLKNTIALKVKHFLISRSGEHATVSNLCYCEETVSGERIILNTEITYFFNPPAGLVRNLYKFIVVPLPFLLLRKLQQWEASRSSTKDLEVKETARHVSKILGLLADYRFEGVHFDAQLFELSKTSVQEFRAHFPGHSTTWRKLGYDDVASLQPSLDPSSPPHTETVSEEVEPNLQTDAIDYLDYSTISRVQMVCLAGKKIVDILNKLGCQSAIFGSLACYLYGNLRSPNDVDILVLPPQGFLISTELLKSAIVEVDPYHFFLIPARDPMAAYRILYFRLNDGPQQTPRTSCKVDVVAPGVMHLPALPVKMINWDQGLPLVPFSLLLLQKLQSWDDHRNSPEELKRLKQAIDVSDVEGLLNLSDIVSLAFSRPWSDQHLFHPDFEALSRMRVKSFCFIFPRHSDIWGRLGFES